MPEPTIEEIEAEILKARFSQDPAEKYLSDRAKQRIQQADLAQQKDERVKAAFLVGYKMAKTERGSILYGFMLGVVACCILFALAFVNALSG